MTSPVPPEVMTLLRRQGGLARRRDLRAAGLRRRALERAVRDGSLQVVTRDVLSARLDRPADTALRAAVVGLAGTACGTSAAQVWGIDLAAVPGVHEVAVPHARSRAQWPGTVVRRRDLPAEDCTVRDGIAVTTPLRTALDLGRTLELAEAVASVDAALRAGLVSVTSLTSALVAVPPGAGRRDLTRVVRLVDPQSGSVLESLCRVLLVQAGLAPPETQLVVRGRDGRVLGRVDFAWPEQRLVVEVDGYAFHADREHYRQDRRRTNGLVLAGWTVLRFSWEDVVCRPDAVVAAVRSVLTGLHHT